MKFSSAVTMERKIANPSDLSERWEIPRFDVKDIFDCNNKLNTNLIETLFKGD